MELKFIDEDMPFWRAEVGRLSLFLGDINFLVSSTNVQQSHEERILARQELVKGALGRKLTILENCLPEGSKYIVLKNMSIADIAIWRLIGWLSSGILDGVPIGILEKYPKITGICLAVDHNPKVQEWIKLTFPKNYSRGNF